VPAWLGYRQGGLPDGISFEPLHQQFILQSVTNGQPEPSRRQGKPTILPAPDSKG